MGWSSGTDIAEVIAKLLLKYVPKKQLKKETLKMLNALQEMDWDCPEEVELFYYAYLLKDGKEDCIDEEDIRDYETKTKKYKKKFGF